MVVVTVSASGCVFAASSFAAAPWWHLSSGARPTYLPPEGKGQIVLTAENFGDASVEGAKSPVRFVDVLPAGLKALAISAGTLYANTYKQFKCGLTSLECTFEGTLEPYEEIEVRIEVEVLPEAQSGEVNGGSVSGGGAPSVSVARPVTISENPVPFGLEEYSFRTEEEGGALDAQAGSHPFQVTADFQFNQGPDKNPPSKNPNVEPAGLAKDIITKLPPGLIGDPIPIPRCTLAQFLVNVNEENQCSAQAAVGVASVTVLLPGGFAVNTYTVPIFNLEPYVGEPARFGFFIPGAAVPIVLDTSVRSDSDYGVTVSSSNITQITGLLNVRTTLWGDPADPRHNDARGWGCVYALAAASGHGIGGPEGTGHPACVGSTAIDPPSFLTMPANCAGALQSSTEADSWAEAGNFKDYPTTEPMQALRGCNRLAFAPSIQASPTTTEASAPSGLDFNIFFKDEGLTSGTGLAQSQLNKTEVLLPEGLTINPSAGVGLVGCTPEDYARETVTSAPGAGCPDESKLGTVEIETPLLAQKISGNIFIAQPYDNPFPERAAGHPNGTLVALYVVAKNPETGILIKLAGKVVPNPATGQLTTVFENNPRLPFSHFNFHFREGQQAPLISPALCGTYSTQAVLTPWSEPLSPLTDSSSFTLTKGYDGGACPSGGLPPFKPGIVSGTLNNNAGSFSPFYLHLTRNDGEQEISGFSTNLPAGLAGDLSGVPFCPEADIEAARQETGAQEEANPSCPAASQIGHTLVGTGVGAVLANVPGKIYLAGPFHGAPLSIVSITSAVVGPFDLGTVVLRFGLNIDPTTAKVNVTPTSSEPIPTIIDGIVTHVRDIRVYIDRPNFILNPTSCNPLSISSTLNTPSGASSTVTSPFQGASCQTLKFAPQLTASTSGHTSRSEGASLHVKLTYPSAALGHYANIAKVKVDLPKQLPSELKTLQHSCPHEVFEADPAGCPAESRVGYAKAITPLIPVPLEGPAYFVSYAGLQFPELIVVLQGYGLTIDLHGETFINSKTNVTSSTFAAVPDEPIGSFELTLPEGKYSALAANGNLCQSTLTMPTAFLAQNGAEIHHSTPIEVTGCKPAINIVRHTVKGSTVTIAAKVPTAGKLLATGSGLTHTTKNTSKAGTLTFTLKLSRHEQSVLHGHPGRKLKVTIKLTFTPKQGKKLSTAVSLNLG
jgi:hypothetical protein